MQGVTHACEPPALFGEQAGIRDGRLAGRFDIGLWLLDRLLGPRAMTRLRSGRVDRRGWLSSTGDDRARNQRTPPLNTSWAASSLDPRLATRTTIRQFFCGDLRNTAPRGGGRSNVR